MENDYPPVPDDVPPEMARYRDKWINRFIVVIFATAIASGCIVALALAFRAARSIAGL